MADTIVSMTFAMAEMIAFIAPPMADMTEPWVGALRLNVEGGSKHFCMR